MGERRLKAEETELVRKLYELYCTGLGGELLDLEPWAEEASLEWSAVEDAYTRLRGYRWVVKPVTTWSVRLQADGILGAESAGNVSRELVRRNDEVRERILLHFWDQGDRRDQRGGPLEELTEDSGFESDEVFRNAEYLVDLGYLTMPVSGYYELTLAGADEAEQFHLAAARRERLQQLKADETISRQNRGHELEELIEHAAEADGWECERNARSPGEELDLVIFRDREYYLLEAKWEADPVEPKDIREFVAKVQLRAGVRGLVVSISGYTKNAIDTARDHLRVSMILLYGPRDVEGLLSGEKRFTDLLNEKVRALVINRSLISE